MAATEDAEMAPCLMCGTPTPEGTGSELCPGCEDGQALEAIAEILRGECGADEIARITEIVAGTGRRAEAYTCASCGLTIESTGGTLWITPRIRGGERCNFSPDGKHALTEI
jgi:hypothetical protein